MTSSEEIEHNKNFLDMHAQVHANTADPRTKQMYELATLQRSLINVAGGNTLIGGRENIGVLAHPRDREHHFRYHDPIASPIMWAPSFIKVTERQARKSAGLPDVAEGLSIIGDGLHNLMLQMGHRAKAAIDLRGAPEGMKALLNLVSTPGIEDSNAERREDDPGYARVLIGKLNRQPEFTFRAITFGDDGKRRIVPVTITNTKLASGDSLLGTLYAYGQLSMGNLSRNGYERPLLKPSGAAENAIASISTCMGELDKQLANARGADGQPLFANPQKVVQDTLGFELDKFHALLNANEDMLQATIVIAGVRGEQLSVDLTKKLLAMVGKTPDEHPIIKTAEDAKRLMWQFAQSLNITVRADLENEGIDVIHFEDIMTKAAQQKPDSPSAVFEHPQAVLLRNYLRAELRHIDQDQREYYEGRLKALDCIDESIAHEAAVRQQLGEQMERLEPTLRGPENFINRASEKVGFGPLSRRTSHLADAVKRHKPTPDELGNIADEVTREFHLAQNPESMPGFGERVSQKLDQKRSREK